MKSKEKLYRERQKFRVIGPAEFVRNPISYLNGINERKKLGLQMYGDGERLIQGKTYESIDVAPLNPYYDAAMIINPNETGLVGLNGFETNVRRLVENLELKLEGFQ